MKPLDSSDLAQYRIPVPRYDGNLRRSGAFRLPRDEDSTLLVIATQGAGWDHVSVSVVLAETSAIPSYDDMQRVFRMFFRPNETAMQLHVPVSEHINCHPHVLHLWRPQRKRIPRPSARLV